MSELSYKNTDFILETKTNEDLINNIERYEAFLSALCKEEYYFQKDAIYEILKFFFSKKYTNLRDLAEENYKINDKLQERFSTEKKYIDHLQLPYKKSCSIDLATGTGKSFVIYGLAQIMLAEGLVDQVLVLCPSRTIESGLTEKFLALSGNKTLKNLLPKGSVLTNPRIINATRTIKKGDICIENIHAVYKNTGSSIYDSLKDKGARTLVLNDEAHHIFNKVSGTTNDNAFKEWKKFLLNDEYSFYYIANFSGTPYIEQDYFLDVVYRYSLKEGMEEQVIKSVEYLIETGDEKKMQGFKEVWNNHNLNRTNYKEIKPISIIITSDIAKCVEVWNELVKFVSKTEGITLEKAKNKAIWVVSGIPSKSSSAGQRVFSLVENPESERKKNLQLLKDVDNPENQVEWIISVAMLTEGWDVKNVFQIVPHESKAFNSKLLIAQVLGRGLRIPEIYKKKNNIKVRVYNHVKFSSHIKNLVDEVLEIENNFSWFPVQPKSEFNFDLFNLSYKKDLEFKQEKREKINFTEKINFSPQSKNIESYNIFKNALTGEESESKYNVETIAFEIEVAGRAIWAMLAAYDTDQGTNFKTTYTQTKIEEILRKNLPEGETFISYDNLNRAKTAFGKLFDTGGSFPYFKNRADDLELLDTSKMTKQYISATSLKREGMCFYTNKTSDSLDGDERATFDNILENEEEYKIKEIDYEKLKSPLNCIVVNYEPERKFTKILFQNIDFFDSFIKNPDKSFYGIPYSFKKGTHMKYQNFHPDFFFKKGNDILVVEIKKDNDDSKENIAKNRDAKRHFKTINGKQNKQQYHFYFLSPDDYLEFFQSVRENRYDTFKSNLMNSLEE